jgi:hypothetical protein
MIAAFLGLAKISVKTAVSGGNWLGWASLGALHDFFRLGPVPKAIFSFHEIPLTHKTQVSRTQKSGHSGAKLSYDGRVRESDRRSLVTVQGRSGW